MSTPEPIPGGLVQPSRELRRYLERETEEYLAAIREQLRRQGGRFTIGTLMGKCPLCEREMGSYATLGRHVRVIHGNGGLYVPFRGGKDVVIVCEDCDKAVRAGKDNCLDKERKMREYAEVCKLAAEWITVEEAASYFSGHSGSAHNCPMLRTDSGGVTVTARGIYREFPLTELAAAFEFYRAAIQVNGYVLPEEPEEERNRDD